MPDYYLYPDGTDLNESAAWTANGAATLHECIDETGTPDDETTYIECNSSVGNRAARFTLSQMTDMVTLSAITVEIRARDDTGGGAHDTWVIFLYIGGTEYTLTPATQVLTGSYVDYTFTTSSPGINPATSVLFTQADLNALILGIRQNSHPTAKGRTTRVRIKVAYTPISGDLDEVRGIASQRLRSLRRPAMIVSMGVPLHWLDNDLMDDWSLAHFELPDVSAPNLTLKKWRRRLLQARQVEIQPDSMNVHVVSRDRRGYLCTIWESLEAIRTSLAEDGNAFLTGGGGSVSTCASDRWLEAPGTSLVTRYAVNQKGLANGGLVIEHSAKNYLQRSSAISGTTGLTRTGVGGTLVTETPTDPLFDSTVTPSCLLLTSGGVAQQRVAWPASDTLAANTKFRLLVDHRDNTGHILSYRIQRAVDAWYWNDATPAWQAGTVDNAFTERATRTRDWSKFIDIGGTGTTITVDLNQPGGTQVNRVYHVEAVDLTAITSRIVTDAATYSRALATYAYPHDPGGTASDKPAIRVAGGTWIGRFTPFWSSSDYSSGTITLWEVVFDANNLLRLQYNAATGALEFVIKQAGTTTTASKASTSLVRDQETVLACRWTSTVGELDLAARTQSVFQDGNKGGTEAVRAADPSDLAASIYLGGSSTVGANGRWRRCLFTQEVYTDAEIQRGAP